MFTTREAQARGTAKPESGRAKEMLYELANASLANGLDPLVLYGGAIRNQMLGPRDELTGFDKALMALSDKVEGSKSKNEAINTLMPRNLPGSGGLS